MSVEINQKEAVSLASKVSVLGRIAPAVDGAIVGNQVTEYASALAAPVSLPTATRVAKER